MVYMDNDATSPTDPRVFEEMKPFLKEKFETPSAIYSSSLDIYKTIENTKEVLSKSINSKPKEIEFTSGLTESNNMAIRGIAQKEKNGHFITTKVEHPSVLETFRHLEDSGFNVDYVEVNDNGIININDLEDKLKEETKLVSINIVENITGAIQPLEKVVEIIRDKSPNAIIHGDAGSAYCKIPIDVKKLDIDLMGFTAHKIHGPKGIGSLYVRDNLELEPLMFGHHSSSDLRPGLENIPGIIGFKKAVELAQEEMEKHSKKVRNIQREIIEEIENNIDNTILNGPEKLDKRSPYNVNYSFLGIEGEAIALRLDEENIQVDTGSACASPDLEPNYVLLAMGRKLEESHGSVKMSLSRFNTLDESEKVVEKLSQVVSDLRNLSPMD